uniref:PGG domain-containing protein n=1 Tax=Oryza glumipatula TaxID=40148 RepID=A0A0E0B232_9ORYZ
MSPSDQVLLFVCLRRVLLLYVAISAVAGEQNITEVVVGDEVVHAITKLQVGGGGVDSARNFTDVDGGDVCHREVHSITEEDGNVDDDEVQYAITNQGVGADGKLSSASQQVFYPARAEANTASAAAGKWRGHRMPTALQPELNSDDGHGQQFDRTDDQIQSSIADRLIATMIIVMLMVVMNGRASEINKKSRRATWFSPVAALTMLLLVVAASANSVTAAGPLAAAAAAGGGRNEAAVAAAASETMPLKAAAPGHSSCTTDPNTQQPVRCIPH